jgi:hypothetical protein
MNERWAEESWAIILPTRACGGPNLGTTWVGGVPEMLKAFWNLSHIHCQNLPPSKSTKIPLPCKLYIYIYIYMDDSWLGHYSWPWGEILKMAYGDRSLLVHVRFDICMQVISLITSNPYFSMSSRLASLLHRTH